MYLSAEFWAGIESTIGAFELANTAVIEAIKAGTFTLDSNNSSDDEIECDHMIEVSGTTAVVSISGTLSNQYRWYNKYFGVTSYSEIQAAISKLVEDVAIRNIVLYFATPGGQASGCEETARFIRNMSAIKNIVSYANVAMSAGQWLCSATSKTYCGRTSNMGSIGSIYVHKNYQEAYKASGIGIELIRSVPEKALATEYEPLTDRARANIRETLAVLDSVFISDIALYRGRTEAYVREHMANGREFVGTGCIKAGLADEMLSLSDLIISLNSIDPLGFQRHN